MRMLLKVLVVLTFTAQLNCSAFTSSEEPPLDEDVSKLSTSQVQFALDFYKSVSNQEKPNRIMSAFSVSTLFTMIYQGSGGDTANEISKTLGYAAADLNRTQVMSAYQKTLGDQFTNPNLTISNSIWYSKSFLLSKTYSEDLVSYFSSSESQLDFGDSNSTDLINDWVNSSTRGKIQELFQEPLDPGTLLVLVNAIYFKGVWKIPFPANNTRDQMFNNNDNASKLVPMMNVRGRFKYLDSKALTAKCVELDYVGTNMSMVIVSPTDTLAVTEENLTQETLQKCFEKSAEATVNLTMPKFKMESDYNLLPIMERLGVRQVFTGMANLTGITDQPGLYVTQAVQKAFVEVNEEGTEASVVSGAATSRSLVMAVEFRVERPFLFFIRDTVSNLIVFTGRVAEL